MPFALSCNAITPLWKQYEKHEERPGRHSTTNRRPRKSRGAPQGGTWLLPRMRRSRLWAVQTAGRGRHFNCWAYYRYCSLRWFPSTPRPSCHTVTASVASSWSGDGLHASFNRWLRRADQLTTASGNLTQVYCTMKIGDVPPARPPARPPYVSALVYTRTHLHRSRSALGR